MTALKIVTVAAALTMAATVSAQALDNGKQILSAGTSQGEGAVQYTSPGMSNAYTENFPNTGQGQQAASIRMPAGTISNLRVNVVTANVPTSGFFRVLLRINGTSTLACSVTGTGMCSKLSSTAVPADALVVLKVYNTFVGSGNLGWTATMEYD
jgi:hypothetical protein